MIRLLFQEWLDFFEAKADPYKKTNFFQFYSLEIKPVLDAMILWGKTHPNFLSPEQKNELENLASSAEKAYEMLFSARSDFETTIFNNRNFDVAYDNDVSNTIKNYLKDGENFQFEKFPSLSAYLSHAAQQKVKFGTSAVVINDITQAIKHLTYKPLINHYQKKTKGQKEKQIGIEGEGGKSLGVSDFGTETQVTRRRESESEALRMVEPLFNCVRKLYEKFAVKIKERTEPKKAEFYALDESVIKELNKLKKDLHKYFVAKFISGMEEKTGEAIPEFNVKDSDLAKVANTAEKNKVKQQIISEEKMTNFLSQQKNKDPEMFNFFMDVTSLLYYIGLIKPIATNREAVIQTRRKFLELIPQDLKQKFNDENLREITYLATKLPKVTYPTNLQELESQDFGKIIERLAISYEFPTSYSEHQRTKSGKNLLNISKVDAMGSFLSPIFELLGNKEALMHLSQTMGQEEFVDMLHKADCDEIFKHFGMMPDEEEV